MKEKDKEMPDGDMIIPPDFFRSEDSPDELSGDPEEEFRDTGTLLLSEMEDSDPVETGFSDAEDNDIDPDATTLNHPIPKESPDRNSAPHTSFDTGTVFAPGGDLDAIDLDMADTDNEDIGDTWDDEDVPDADENMANAETVIMPEPPLGQKADPAEKKAPSFHPAISDIVISRDELDFDFVSREDEDESVPDEEYIDMNAETVIAPAGYAPDKTQPAPPQEETGKNFTDGGIPVFDLDAAEDMWKDASDEPESPAQLSPETDDDVFLLEPEQVAGKEESEESGRRNIEKSIEDATVFNFAENDAAEMAESQQKSEKDSEEKVFRDARTVVASESDLRNSGIEIEKDSSGEEEDTVLELGAEAIIESDEDEIILQTNDIVADAEEESYDPDAETVIATAEDIQTLRPEDVSDLFPETSHAGSNDIAGDASDDIPKTEHLLLGDEDELPDMNSIPDTSDADETIQDLPAEMLSAPDKKDNSKDAGDNDFNDNHNDTIGFLNALEAENLKQPSAEESFFNLPDMERRPAETSPEKKTSRPQSPLPSEKDRDGDLSDISADLLPDIPPAEKRKKSFGTEYAHSGETEAECDGATEKHYFSVSPGQIEAALERVINNIFSERIEKVVKEVIEKAVEKEMKKFRELFIEEVSEGE